MCTHMLESVLLEYLKSAKKNREQVLCKVMKYSPRDIARALLKVENPESFIDKIYAIIKRLECKHIEIIHLLLSLTAVITQNKSGLRISRSFNHNILRILAVLSSKIQDDLTEQGYGSIAAPRTLEILAKVLSPLKFAKLICSMADSTKLRTQLVFLEFVKRRKRKGFQKLYDRKTLAVATRCIKLPCQPSRIRLFNAVFEAIYRIDCESIREEVIAAALKIRSMAAVKCLAKLDQNIALDIMRSMPYSPDVLTMLRRMKVSTAVEVYFESIFPKIFADLQINSLPLLADLCLKMPTVKMIEYIERHPLLLCKICSNFRDRSKYLDDLSSDMDTSDNASKAIPGLAYQQTSEKENSKSQKTGLCLQQNYKITKQDFINELSTSLYITFASAIVDNTTEILEYLAKVKQLMTTKELDGLAAIASKRGNGHALCALFKSFNQDILFSRTLEFLELGDPYAYELLSVIDIPQQSAQNALMVLWSFAKQKLTTKGLHALSRLVGMQRKIDYKFISQIIWSVVGTNLQERTLRKAAFDFISKVCCKIGISEVIGFFPLDSSSKIERKNIRRMFAMLIATHAYALLPILLLDYARENTRANILGILAQSKEIRFIPVIMPLVRHGIANRDPVIRRQGFRAATNIVALSEDRELARDIWHLVYYFIMDDAMKEEFEQLVLAIIKKISFKEIKDQLDIGMAHPTRLIRERYTDIFNMCSLSLMNSEINKH